MDKHAATARIYTQHGKLIHSVQLDTRRNIPRSLLLTSFSGGMHTNSYGYIPVHFVTKQCAHFCYFIFWSRNRTTRTRQSIDRVTESSSSFERWCPHLITMSSDWIAHLAHLVLISTHHKIIAKYVATTATNSIVTPRQRSYLYTGHTQ